MAQLTTSLVNGDLRVTGTIYGNSINGGPFEPELKYSRNVLKTMIDGVTWPGDASGGDTNGRIIGFNSTSYISAASNQYGIRFGTTGCLTFNNSYILEKIDPSVTGNYGQSHAFRGLCNYALNAVSATTSSSAASADYAAQAGQATLATSASYLSTSRLIDGIQFNGTMNIFHYGTCSTAAGTATKVVTLANTSNSYGSTLSTGSRITVYFSNTNTAAVADLKLSVSGIAKPIKINGANLSTPDTIAGGHYYDFIYDGTNWNLYHSPVMFEEVIGIIGETGGQNGTSSVSDISAILTRGHIPVCYVPNVGACIYSRYKQGWYQFATNEYYDNNYPGIYMMYINKDENVWYGEFIQYKFEPLLTVSRKVIKTSLQQNNQVWNETYPDDNGEIIGLNCSATPNNNRTGFGIALNCPGTMLGGLTFTETVSGTTTTSYILTYANGTYTGGKKFHFYGSSEYAVLAGTANSATNATNSTNATNAGYLHYKHTNEINFKNVPTSGNQANHWFNYRNGDSDSLDSSNKLSNYYFGDRNGTSDGVVLNAGRIKLSDTSEPYIKLTRNGSAMISFDASENARGLYDEKSGSNNWIMARIHKSGYSGNAFNTVFDTATDNLGSYGYNLANEGFGFFNVNFSTTDSANNWNNLIRSGIYRIFNSSSSVTGRPDTDSDWGLLVISTSASNVMQFAMRSTKLKYRAKLNDAWQSWKTITFT